MALWEVEARFDTEKLPEALSRFFKEEVVLCYHGSGTDLSNTYILRTVEYYLSSEKPGIEKADSSPQDHFPEIDGSILGESFHLEMHPRGASDYSGRIYLAVEEGSSEIGPGSLTVEDAKSNLDLSYSDIRWIVSNMEEMDIQRYSGNSPHG